MKFYILDDKNPKEVADKSEWRNWMDRCGYECIVAETTVNGNILVSTFFTGYSSDKHPLVFTTVILGGLHASYNKKHESWAAALQGHADAVNMIMAELN